jgi:GTP cyclohydrolase IA
LNTHPTFDLSSVDKVIDDMAGQAEPTSHRVRPSRDAAESAVKTLLAWAGDDPDRDGLRDTPKRVVDAYGDYFSGYTANVAAELATTFETTNAYKDMVMLRDITVASHCEHHIAPFTGVAHVAYVPSGRIVGLSKLARVVEIFCRRLQTQENLTSLIAEAIAAELQPGGVAVMIVAEHQCMAMRGVRQHGVSTITTRFTGVFETDTSLRDRFMLLSQASRT